MYKVINNYWEKDTFELFQKSFAEWRNSNKYQYFRKRGNWPLDDEWQGLFDEDVHEPSAIATHYYNDLLENSNCLKVCDITSNIKSVVKITRQMKKNPFYRKGLHNYNFPYEYWMLIKHMFLERENFLGKYADEFNIDKSKVEVYNFAICHEKEYFQYPDALYDDDPEEMFNWNPFLIGMLNVDETPTEIIVDKKNIVLNPNDFIITDSRILYPENSSGYWNFNLKFYLTDESDGYHDPFAAFSWFRVNENSIESIHGMTMEPEHLCAKFD